MEVRACSEGPTVFYILLDAGRKELSSHKAASAGRLSLAIFG
jgi:hypothetical protein